MDRKLTGSRFAWFSFLAWMALFAGVAARAEDLPRVQDDVKGIVRTLASSPYFGRGYTKGGMAKAADFVERELRAARVAPLTGNSFRQSFTMPVNTFPGKMALKLNGRALAPGSEFIVSPSSIGGKRSGKLFAKSDSEFTDSSGEVTLALKEKLTWSVSRKNEPKTALSVDRAKFGETPTRFSFDIESKFEGSFGADNVTGVVRGTVDPERYIFLTAHYDHLGGMGDRTFFPGANDNASGVALVLSLAKYFAAHPQPFSIAFVFFAAEEAGLVGSKYFVENPPVDLKKIRFVMNFDLVGTGEEGATVVNATEFPAEFAALQKINAEGGYLPRIGSRGKAPNSDHYWFSEHGVPAFFLYTTGGIKAYHDVYDRAKTLPLNKIDDVFALTLKFSRKLAEE